MDGSANQLLTVGQLARRAGRRPSSIRYYEAIGLLPEPQRVGGQRRYPAETLRALTVIDTAQRAGLALHEVAELMAASPSDPASVERLRQVAERKLPEIDGLIERTQLVRTWLQTAARCECPALDDCALFEEPNLPPPRHTRARSRV